MRVAQVDPPACRRLIEEDLICGSCGYNLRGQTLDARCPECGIPVARSARTDLLRSCDRAWLNAIAIGLVLFIICAALALVYKITWSIALRGYMNAATFDQEMAWSRFLTWYSLAANVLMQSLTLFGIYLVTRAEPGRVQVDQRLRRIARIFILIAVGFMAVVWLPSFNYLINGRYLYGGAVIYVAQVAAGGASLIAVIALFILARRLAFRIPDEPLARRTAIAAVGIVAIMLFEGIYSWTDSFGLFFTISGEASRYLRHLPQAIVTVWAIVLLVQYRSRILAVQ